MVEATGNSSVGTSKVLRRRKSVVHAVPEPGVFRAQNIAHKRVLRLKLKVLESLPRISIQEPTSEMKVVLKPAEKSLCC